jgi:hypothetical protein
VTQALGTCAGVSLALEPDSERLHPEALAAKARLGLYPVLDVGDRAAGYERLFVSAFTDADGRLSWRRRAARRLMVSADDGEREAVMDVNRPAGRWPWRLASARSLVPKPPIGDPPNGPRIVKSVHCGFALEWLADRIAIDAVAVTVRHPANVINSWRKFEWTLDNFPWSDARIWDRFGPPERNPGPHRPGTYIESAAWQFGLFANAVLASAERHGWPVVDHEHMIEHPEVAFPELAERVGLQWTERGADWLRQHDAPGEGYELKRVLADERGRWKDRLSAEDRAVVEDVLGRFPRVRDRWMLTSA